MTVYGADPCVDWRPLPLADAARLAGLTEEELLYITEHPDDLPPDDRLMCLPGYFFDPWQMLAFRAIFGGESGC